MKKMARMQEMVDPRLIKQIEQARDDEEVEAVVTVDRKSSTRGIADQRGVAGPVLDRVVKAARQEPSRVHFLPSLGAVYLKGAPELVRRLLRDAEVNSATAIEDDFHIEG